MDKLTPKLKIKRMGSFKTYVGLEEYEMKTHRSSTSEQLEPSLLNGEIIVALATEVNLFTTLSRNSGIPGALFVTNARIIFVSFVQGWEEYSVPLLSVHSLHYYEDDKRKGRHRIKMTSPSGSKSQPLSARGTTRIYEILVTCSNFKTLNVSFKSSKIDQGIHIFNAILKFALPDTLEKSFYLNYKSGMPSESDAAKSCYNSLNRLVPYMDNEQDWKHELKKCRVTANRFKPSDMNKGFQLCDTLPEWIVVPDYGPDSKTSRDYYERLLELAKKLNGSRPPFWVWGNDRDSAIIRMGKLQQETDLDKENSFFEILRKSNCDMRPAKIEDIESVLPPKEIKVSFNRLVELCCPESISHYEENDAKFLSSLENSKWLLWVCRALEKSKELVDLVHHRPEILVLRETESRDVTCLVSSLVQIILDPRFRTAVGFLSLVQKEWIAAGHPFHQIYLHSSSTFLLFLDCVYQLLEQNPFDFEFNEVLLADIWDSTFDSTTGTFLFDSPKQRSVLDIRRDLSFWHRAFEKINAYVPKETDSFIEKRKAIASSTAFVFPGQHFKFPIAGSELRLVSQYQNPMYKLKALLNTKPAMSMSIHNQHILCCSSCICDVMLWRSLYLKRTLHSNPLVTSGKARDSIGSKADSIPSTPDSPKVAETLAGAAAATALTSGDSQGSYHRFTGRSPSVELKLVDSLLSALSNSNRYSRNFRSMSPQQKIPPTPPPKPPLPGVRRNPFTRL